MATGYLLTERDRALIRETIARVAALPVQQTRPRFADANVHAPEVYVAKTGVDGIPALEDAPGTGTGTTANEDFPGSADCDIYQVIDVSGNATLLPTGEFRTVYNLSPVSVPPLAWVLVARDKFGTWFVTQVEGEGASESIHIWANCTISGMTVTVEHNDRIPICQRIAQGRFLFIFSVDFFDREAFTPTGIVGDIDFFREIKALRSSNSCVLETGSHTDPSEAFGITIHGKIVEGGTDDGTTLGTGTGTGTGDTGYFTDSTCCSVPIPTTFDIELTGMSFLGLDDTLTITANLFYADAESTTWMAVHTVYTGQDPFTFTVVFVCDNATETFTTTWAARGGGYAGTDVYTHGTFDTGDGLTCDPFSFSACSDVYFFNNGSDELTGDTICIEVGSGSPTAPSVTFSDNDLCQDNTTVLIAGTNFDDVTPGNNVVTFNLGATGTCTSATSTQLTVTFGTNPTSLGALTAVVVNSNGSSTPAVQVATIIDCATTPPNGIAVVNVARVQGTNTISTSVTVPSNGRLMIHVATMDATGDPQVIYDGTGPLLADTLVTPFGDSTYQLRIFSVDATADTFNLDVTIDGGATGQIGVIVQVVTGLVGAGTLDGSNGTSGVGFLPPETGEITTLVADEAMLASFIFKLPVTGAWAFNNGFTTTAQDIIFTVGSDSWFFVTGKQIVNATGTYEALIIGDPPTAFGGIIVSYS